MAPPLDFFPLALPSSLYQRCKGHISYAPAPRAPPFVRSCVCRASLLWHLLLGVLFIRKRPAFSYIYQYGKAVVVSTKFLR